MSWIAMHMRTSWAQKPPNITWINSYVRWWRNGEKLLNCARNSRRRSMIRTEGRSSKKNCKTLYGPSTQLSVTSIGAHSSIIVASMVHQTRRRLVEKREYCSPTSFLLPKTICSIASSSRRDWNASSKSKNPAAQSTSRAAVTTGRVEFKIRIGKS